MWRDELRKHGFNAHRGQQFAGGGDSPDVVCEELKAILHPEVKFVERLNVREAMKQAERDAGERMPYVAHKTAREPWLVTLHADDFLDLVRSYLADHPTPNLNEHDTTLPSS
jgi:Holliday junction resolvase